jgi:hypothetical protein
MVTAIHDQAQDHLLIAANVVTVHAIHDQVLIVQRVVPTEIVTHVQVPVQIEENAVTVHAIHDQVLIVEIVVQVPIAQPVVHTATAIHDQVPVHLQIVGSAATVHATHAQLQIAHVAKIHTVAIVHALAMTVTPVRLRVTANAVADQIVPEVASPMIAKNVHAAALAKSA